MKSSKNSHPGMFDARKNSHSKIPMISPYYSVEFPSFHYVLCLNHLKSLSGQIIYVLFPMVILYPKCIPHHWRFLNSWGIPVVTIGVKALWDVSFRPGEPGWGDKAWLRTNHGAYLLFFFIGIHELISK